jgi:UDP-N-acetylmuramyl pentapeptide phosphotransferase/UDP-N-acetylglucosamine-1-phosphate transferase
MRSFVRALPDPDGTVQHAAWAPLVSFATALALTGGLLHSRWARLALDHPNRRSLHLTPVPRVGGIGILAGVAVAATLLRPDVPALMWAALALLAFVSLADDVRGVPVRLRFAAHLAAAAVTAGALLGLANPALLVIAALATAWMVNLYNFMDGSDGLAGGMALIGFLIYGIAAWLAGETVHAWLNFAVAAAAAGFLCFNFPPARVFLGDVGSVPLGFLAAALGLAGWVHGTWTWWFPVLVFSPFVMDASVTLVRRLARRERVWEAHFDHYYQRLVRMGWGHRRTALAAYAVMAAMGAAAIVGLRIDAAGQAALLGAAGLVYVKIALRIDRAWRRFQDEARA